MAERKKVLLRLDPQVYEAIARWAADDLRSINAQIEYALRRALHGAGRAHATPSGPPAGSDAAPASGPGPDPARSSAEDGRGG